MKDQENIGRVLYIDLTKKRFRVENRTELFKKYIGGSGVAIQLLTEECPQGIDPLSAENTIILAVSAMTGVFPFSSKTIAMFKSPHTGNLGESHGGGRSAIAIRMAGYGAIVISGKSEIPIYLAIKDGKVEFKNANTLWGMTSSFTVGDVIRENETDAGLRTIMRIGLAGEKMVSYASVVTETYRHFGRLGLGAVFGSKMLKGIMIAGKKNIDIPKKKEYIRIYNEIYKKAVESTVMKKYHDLGTAGNIIPLNLLEALPTKNLQQSSFENANELSGEKIAENFLGRRVACGHCPTACIHLAAFREPYIDETHFYKTTMVGYDYELIYSLGTMLGISSAEKMLKLIEPVEVYCLDAITTGVVLAWATEAFQKKLIGTEHTDGIVPDWGNLEAFSLMIEKIVSQPTDFYKALAKGVDYASSVYGGRDFALSFGKNEMAGYHTGPASYIGFLLGLRHSHLDNAGYSIDQNELINESLSPEQVVDRLMKEESLRQVLSSASVCFFARGIYKPEIIQAALSAMGYEKTVEELMETGWEIYKEKYRYKIREGFSIKELRIPGRIFETKDPTGMLTREFIEKALRYAEEKLTEMIEKVE